jgi:hypothetical protein
MICCLLTALSAIGLAKAQTGNAIESEPAFEEPRHEIALSGGGGMSALNYSLDKGGSRTDGTGGISGFAGIAYIWNINNSVGVVTGLDLMSYGAKTTYDAVQKDKNYYDRWVFSYKINNYIEEHDVSYLSIPVMFQYSVPLSGSKKFYVSGGFKVGFPIQAKATIFPGSIDTWGYYYDVEHKYETDDITDMSPEGFVRNHQPGYISGEIDVNALFTASLETGARFFLSRNILLYASAYLDYGLNNIRSSSNNNLINYQELTPSVFRYASVLNTPHVNKVKTLGVGLKVKVSFGWGKSKKQ